MKTVTIGDNVTIINADMRVALAAMDPESIDAIVCDPSYGLEFMDKGWDHGVPGTEFWFEALRVLKPGGHLFAFGGTRTYHRLMVAIEDAGFEIRDCLSWMYGSGFPKSMDIGKAIDKAAGATREVVGQRTDGRYAHGFSEEAKKAMAPEPQPMASNTGHTGTAPATPEAEQWDGWGSALKPSWEPIVMARKVLRVGGKKATLVKNVLEHGTGALNIEATRIGFTSEADEKESKDKNRHGDFGSPQGGNQVYGDYSMLDPRTNYDPPGRWPANTLLVHHEDCLDEKCVDDCPVRLLDAQTGTQKSGVAVQRNRDGEVHNEVYGARKTPPVPDAGYGDIGGASRFFYSAKAPKMERHAGMPDGKLNSHPTVKPVAVMAWLVKMVTPPGGLVLDPFMGSGTTGIAAVQGGFRFVGVDSDTEHGYCNIAWHRIRHVIKAVTDA